ncbi:MAG: type III-B CRISPR module-associated protein Cmr3 [Synergistales bacterium]|nr:type III-B CRISPR module-associated protein Cmr3 [Synergistales bacterium]
MVTFRVTPKDPVIARDGRPFGNGSRMHSLDWPRASTVAGSLRTMVGKRAGASFDEGLVLSLKAMEVYGPLPLSSKGDESWLFFPAPKDVLIKKGDKDDREVFVLRPEKVEEGCGTDLGLEFLPAMDPKPKEAFKPSAVPPLWRSDLMVSWLLGKSREVPADGDRVMDLPHKEDRVHVAIDPFTGASLEGMLFSTTALDLRREGLSLSLKVESEDLSDSLVGGHHPLGGERRLARWDRSKDEALWSCPDEIRAALKGLRPGDGIRLVLGTSAVFDGGWMPGWLKDKGEGFVPGTSVKVSLVSASTGRWEALSGWSYETKRPKPLYRMVPAGSVYFLRLLEGSAEELAQTWLNPMSDREVHRKDGLGLALWGLWK